MKKFLNTMALSLLWCTMAIALPKCNGQDTSKWTMCEGTKSRDDGVIYVGEWKNNKFVK